MGIRQSLMGRASGAWAIKDRQRSTSASRDRLRWLLLVTRSYFLLKLFTVVSRVLQLTSGAGTWHNLHSETWSGRTTVARASYAQSSRPTPASLPTWSRRTECSISWMRPSYRASRSRTWRHITSSVGSCTGNSAGPRGDGIAAGAVPGGHSRSSQRLIGPNQIVEQVGG